MTVTEFIDLLSKTDIVEGQIWLEEWQNELGDEWEEIKSSELTQEFIFEFAQTIASHIWSRIVSICTDALYKLMVKAGHDFLIEICEKANECEIEVSLDEIDTCLTITEAMQSRGLVSIDEEGGVNLTDKGEKLAQEVQSQIDQ